MIEYDELLAKIYTNLHETRRLVHLKYTPSVQEVNRRRTEYQSLQKGLLANKRKDIDTELGIIVERELVTSRPYLTAQFLKEMIGGHHLLGAYAYATKGDIPEFVYWFDLADGTMKIVGSFFAAEKTKLGLADSTIRDAFRTSEVVALDVPAAELTNHYLYELRYAKEALDVLETDPTGFSLIDDCVERLSGEITGQAAGPFGRDDYQQPEFVTWGATLAAAVYRSVYPLTQRFFKDED